MQVLVQTLLLCAIWFCCLTSLTFADASVSATCYFDAQQQQYYVKQGVIDPSGIAWGTYFEELEQTGWSRLYIHSNPEFEDEMQMFCAGYVEGTLTSSRIAQWLTTYRINFFSNKSMSDDLRNYMIGQMKWARGNADTLSSSSPIWKHVGYIFNQFDGLVQGVAEQVVQQGLPSITEFDLYMLNSAGDLLTLAEVYPQTTHDMSHKLKFQKGSRDSSHVDDGHNERFQHLECSALVKNTGKDLFVSHSTWTAYYSMHRIFKSYDLPLNDENVSAHKVIFSSRPSVLQSKDDFYMMDSGLVSLETTNDIFNTTLYDLYITPESLLTWQRVIIANRLAATGKQWTEIFSQYNSGTYNNQWMIVDYNRYFVGAPIQPGTLWIVEQIPGFTESADVSRYLALNSYWPSYNVPYFSFIYNMSGYQNGSALDGKGNDYVTAPRALIFARDQGKVVDMATMKHIMQENDYENDPLSQGDPGNAICSRYDLRTKSPPAFGAIDAKISSVENMVDMACDAISGPTHQQQPQFKWSPNFDNVYHVGLPEVWDFDWQHIVSTD